MGLFIGVFRDFCPLGFTWAAPPASARLYRYTSRQWGRWAGEVRYFITGATGFFGRALARALLDGGAERVVCYSRSESRQALLADQLRYFPNVRHRLGDVRDRERLEEAMWGCDTIVHCAALKRVDSVAFDPGEVRKTNVIGSANVIAAALAVGARRVLMISSDKAAAPTTSYGASKAQMEHEAIASNSITAPRGLHVSCTRWGNVLRSTGSVTEVWREQLRRGAPLTVTDPSMTRFIISRYDAVRFCLAALDWMDFRKAYPTERAKGVEGVRAAWRDHPSLAATRPHE